MRDRKLERNIVRVEAFIERWKELGAYLDTGFRGEVASEDAEAAFLDLKSAIAQEHELMTMTLGSEAERNDKVLRLLSGLGSLGALHGFEESQQKRISSDWHALYLNWQALLGRLRGRQVQLASMSSMRVSVKRVFAHPLMIIFLLAAAGYGVYRLAEDLLPRLMELGDKVS